MLERLLLTKNKINNAQKKQFELEFYGVIVLAMTFIGNSFSVIASLILLLIFILRLRAIQQFLYQPPLKALQKSHVGWTKFEQLSMWSANNDYQSQYAASDALARELFQTLKVHFNVELTQLCQSIAHNAPHIRSLPKPIQQYLAQNPVMWDMGYAQSLASKKKIYLPLQDIHQFANSI
jgi:hypothetical protein